MSERAAVAVEMQDTVMQELVKARWCFGTDRPVEGMEYLDAATASAQALIDRALRESGVPRDKIFEGR